MSQHSLKHAVIETSRHGDQGAKVQVVGPFGMLGIVVPAAGNAEHMTEAEKIEALRNALRATEAASEHLEEHLRKIAPEEVDAPQKPHVKLVTE